jgi:uncharacterized protein (TIGR03435 family)
MRLRKSLPLLAAALIGSVALAQQTIAPAPTVTAVVPAFEVASIKPAATTAVGWRLEPTPDGFTGRNISLLKLVGEAHGVFDVKLIIGGPPWIDSDKFDLEAKFNAAEIPDAKNLTYRQRADMLQPLLANRFHLKIHRESRAFPIYDLVIAKGGTKLMQTKPEDVYQSVSGASCLIRRSGRGHVQMQGCMPKDLEDLLRFATGRTVIDKTGITTRSDIELHWTPDNTPADAPEASGPAIFTALQEQLGLKLVPATAPLSILVIDSATRPSEN